MNEDCENAIVVSLNTDVSEIKQLADSLDYCVVEEFFQRKQIPDVNSYMGPGKVTEIKEFIEGFDDDIHLVIVDGELKPSQWFFLEKKLGVNVFDRIRLILAIFENRADRKEAKLQVKLAQLQYERPFIRELIHRARSGEHPGLMAGGEYQVDDYYEMIKKQTKKIRNSLKKIRNERELRRQHRHRGGFYLVSLAGYTNAGKSSLLNLLSDENVKVEGKLFSTLSTTTRRLKDENVPVLLTDTVGFIQNLPAIIVDAFHSTLEEIELADVVLLVVDISEEKNIVGNKLRVSLDELVELGVTSSIVVVCNKIDLLTKNEIEDKIDYLRSNVLKDDKKIVCISVENKDNIDVLLDVLYESLPHLFRFSIKLPFDKKSQSLISWIYEKANVLDISYDDCIIVSVESDAGVKDKIVSRCNDLDGSAIG